MRALKLAVRTLCIIPFVTGAIDIVNGVGLLTFGGAHLENVASDPVLNSQVGFWGAIWFGFGVVLWRASSHLRNEANLFRLLSGTIALSGLARLGAAFAYGLPGPVLTVAMIVELTTGVGFLFWHASNLRHPDPHRAKAIEPPQATQSAQTVTSQGFGGHGPATVEPVEISHGARGARCRIVALRPTAACGGKAACCRSLTRGCKTALGSIASSTPPSRITARAAWSAASIENTMSA